MTVLDLAKEWLRYAQSDLNTATHMFYDVHTKETEISCYHSQQCAEKALKAYLVSKGITPPYTHDLLELSNLCTAQEKDFSNLQPCCVSLNPYSVHTRYPNELEIDDTIAKLALDKAQFVYQFVVKKIQGNINGQNDGTNDEFPTD